MAQGVFLSRCGLEGKSNGPEVGPGERGEARTGFRHPNIHVLFFRNVPCALSTYVHKT